MENLLLGSRRCGFLSRSCTTAVKLSLSSSVELRDIQRPPAAPLAVPAFPLPASRLSDMLTAPSECQDATDDRHKDHSSNHKLNLEFGGGRVSTDKVRIRNEGVKNVACERLGTRR